MGILNKFLHGIAPSPQRILLHQIDSIVNKITEQMVGLSLESKTSFLEIEIRLSASTYKKFEMITDLDQQIANKLVNNPSLPISDDSLIITILCDVQLNEEFKVILFEGLRDEPTKTIQLSDASREYGNGFLLTTTKRSYQLYADLTTIGRNTENDICIEDAYISRNHGQIRLINDRYHYFDLKSSGGTKINGENISQKILAQGDVLFIGKTTLIFMQDESEDDESGTAPIKIQVL